MGNSTTRIETESFLKDLNNIQPYCRDLALTKCSYELKTNDQTNKEFSNCADTLYHKCYDNLLMKAGNKIISESYT